MTAARRRGFTLIEVMISVALLIVVALLVAPLFHMGQVSLTLNDARSLMKDQAQSAAVRIASNLREARRIYCRQVTQLLPLTVTDFFSASLGLGGSTPKMPGTLLPLRKASLAVSNTGNALFFARQLPSRDIAAGPQIVRVDLYQFYYYYVSINAALPPVAGLPARQLYEWKSVPYADISQVENMPNPLRETVVKALFDQGILWAYDISLADFTDAFFKLDESGAIFLDADHSIRGSTLVALTSSSGGRVFSNFQLGISPNSAELRFPADIPVPRVPSADWRPPSPSGFEVVLQGSSLQGTRGNSLIQIRMVLAVSGPIKRPILQHEEDVSVLVRDVW
ncbi:MAG: prepilin-type N-terminal cleavage/methylation domain-containing protein [Elusimicrobia bacterium]|nr:prepilin-type N-terminal cleavage/methylation domain-containing protein [Elusimicrobiota bacterium]